MKKLILVLEKGSFNLSDQAITKLDNDYSGLTINGVEDKDGFRTVSAARKVIKNYRVSVDKRRKELTADALYFQRAINAEAKRITELLEPLETKLLNQENWFEEEQAKIKKELQEKKRERFATRANQLQSIGFRFDFSKDGFICDYDFGMIDKSTLEFQNDVAFNELISDLNKKYQIYIKEKLEEEQRIQQEKDVAECYAKREKALLLRGFILNGNNVFLLELGCLYIQLPELKIKNCSNDEFSELIVETDMTIAREKENLAKERKAESDRIEKEKADLAAERQRLKQIEEQQATEAKRIQDEHDKLIIKESFSVTTEPLDQEIISSGVEINLSNIEINKENNIETNVKLNSDDPSIMHMKINDLGMADEEKLSDLDEVRKTLKNKTAKISVIDIDGNKFSMDIETLNKNFEGINFIHGTILTPYGILLQFVKKLSNISETHYHMDNDIAINEIEEEAQEILKQIV